MVEGEKESRRVSSSDTSGLRSNSVYSRGLFERLEVGDGHVLVSEEEGGEGLRTFTFEDHKPLTIKVHSIVPAGDGRVGYVELETVPQYDGGALTNNPGVDQNLVLVLKPQT